MKRLAFISGGILAILLLLVGCAKKPTEEIQEAENAIAQAKQAGAEKYASASFRAAEDKYREGMDLVDTKKYKNAVPLLEETVRLADAARQEAIDAKRIEEEKRKAEEAKAAAEAQAAQETSSATTIHKVKRGECLWNIAGYRKIYSDPWKWQKIFNENRDKIRDPDLIFPGQELVIPQ